MSLARSRRRWNGTLKVGRRTAKENGLPLGQLKAIPARGKIDGCRSMRPVANPPVFRMFPAVLLASEPYAARAATRQRTPGARGECEARRHRLAIANRDF